MKKRVKVFPLLFAFVLLLLCSACGASKGSASQSEITVFNTEDASFIIKRMIPETGKGFALEVFLENKTSNLLNYSWTDVSVNGYMVETRWEKAVSAGKKLNTSILIEEDQLKANDISKVDEVEFRLLIVPEIDYVLDLDKTIEDTVYTLNVSYPGNALNPDESSKQADNSQQMKELETAENTDSQTSEKPQTDENKDHSDPTSAKELPTIMNVNIEGSASDMLGSYTGSLQNGLPGGEGVFEAELDQGYILSYTGEFLNGQINGYGVLEISNNGNVEIQYDGFFINGALNGYGWTTMVNGDNTLYRTGTYTEGVFTPTTGEACDYLGQLDLMGKYYLSEDQLSYIDNHPELFPSADYQTIESTPLMDFEYRQFIKTRKQTTPGLVELDLTALQVFEYYIDEVGSTVTYLLAYDDNGDYYTLYYLGTAEVYQDDTFTAYAIPVDATSFDNVSGGTTNALVLIASYLDVYM